MRRGITSRHDKPKQLYDIFYGAAPRLIREYFADECERRPRHRLLLYFAHGRSRPISKIAFAGGRWGALCATAVGRPARHLGRRNIAFSSPATDKRAFRARRAPASPGGRSSIWPPWRSATPARCFGPRLQLRGTMSKRYARAQKFRRATACR